nr:lysine-rich arabinogalactan protein 19-like [Penaeus vannamei]
MSHAPGTPTRLLDSKSDAAAGLMAGATFKSGPPRAPAPPAGFAIPKKFPLLSPRNRNPSPTQISHYLPPPHLPHLHQQQLSASPPHAPGPARAANLPQVTQPPTAPPSAPPTGPLSALPQALLLLLLPQGPAAV